MLTIILTAYKEEHTINRAIKSLIDINFSGIGKDDSSIDDVIELLVIAPDKPTKNAALGSITDLVANNSTPKNFSYEILTDPAKGKPHALNICFEKAKGDWLFLSDGDVFLEKNSLKNIIEYVKNTKSNIGGVSTRPISMDDKNTSMLDYWGNLLADAAHHKRQIDLTKHSEGFSTKIVKKRAFFPLSGYGMLIRNIGFQIPEDTLVDDAYISYELYNSGYKLGYAPNSTVLVKYPQNLSDYFQQKTRSAGGYVQLWKYGVVKENTKSRSFYRELEYFWFPILYAKSFKQLIWSIMLYPTRLWLWIKIYWERKVIHKDFDKTWVRIESTK